MAKIDYTDSEHIWPGNDAAALLDGATSPLFSAADAHQARQDDRLTALEKGLAQAQRLVLELTAWRVRDTEPWRQEVYQRLANLEAAEAHRRMNEGES